MHRIITKLKRRNNPNLVDMELLTRSNVSMSYHFDGDKDTKIIIHDYMQSAADPIISGIKDGKHISIQT